MYVRSSNNGLILDYRSFTFGCNSDASIILIPCAWYLTSEKSCCRIYTSLVFERILGQFTKFERMRYVSLQDPTFLFLGGFLIAMAIEKAKIHRRLAMRAILIVGPNPKW